MPHHSYLHHGTDGWQVGERFPRRRTVHADERVFAQYVGPRVGLQALQRFDAELVELLVHARAKVGRRNAIDRFRRFRTVHQDAVVASAGKYATIFLRREIRNVFLEDLETFAYRIVGKHIELVNAFSNK